MKNWMRTKEWQAEIARDKALKNEPMAHVKAYWDYRFTLADAKAPKITPQPIKQTLGGTRNWYEKGYASPTQTRYPSFAEDPTAYMIGD